jgi:hypothetical protein
VTASHTEHFYREVPTMPSFAKATEGRTHIDVPKDWWIVIADVIGSTQAIESGAYKKVNTVGVACIAAVINVDREIDLPFVFGGDGATFAVPESMRERVMMALRAAQKLSRESFGLSLRVGLVSVGDLAQQGYWVRLGKVRLSEHMTQPVFSGRGWEEAERRVKAAGADVLTVEEQNGIADGKFDGFECRWQAVPSFKGHKLALLVAAVSPNPEQNLKTYQNVLEKIQSIYGDVEEYHPLRAEQMQMTFNPKLLSHELRVRTAHLSLFKRASYLIKMIWENLAGSVLFAAKLDTKEVNWSQYRNEMVENSDFQKFDGMLRMVIDGSEEQTQQLRDYLDALYRQGLLVYGKHKSKEALVTCIVQSYNGKHQHFVDGGDGGYALAAREFKRRLKVLKSQNAT